jgi:hypothetical protein
VRWDRAESSPVPPNKEHTVKQILEKFIRKESQRHSSQAAIQIFLGLCYVKCRRFSGVLRCDSLEQVKSVQKEPRNREGTEGDKDSRSSHILSLHKGWMLLIDSPSSGRLI